MTVSQAARVTLVFCGEQYPVTPGTPLTVGREGDIEVDDNQYLHRRLLEVKDDAGVWWLTNVGQLIPVSVSTEHGEFQATLGPGASLPILFPAMTVMFSAGAFTYDLTVMCDVPAMVPAEARTETDDGNQTIGPIELTESQKALVVAMCEPLLRSPGGGVSAVPTSQDAAQRLGWPLTTFNRKLDAVCDKLSRGGVEGLRGGAGNLAVNRKTRLVEYAVLSRMVTPHDLELLDTAHSADGKK